jgi:hypothetical protein
VGDENDLSSKMDTDNTASSTKKETTTSKPTATTTNKPNESNKNSTTELSPVRHFSLPLSFNSAQLNLG